MKFAIRINVQGRFKIIGFGSFDKWKHDLCDIPTFVITWCGWVCEKDQSNCCLHVLFIGTQLSVVSTALQVFRKLLVIAFRKYMITGFVWALQYEGNRKWILRKWKLSFVFQALSDFAFSQRLSISEGWKWNGKFVGKLLKRECTYGEDLSGEGCGCQLQSRRSKLLDVCSVDLSDASV